MVVCAMSPASYLLIEMLLTTQCSSQHQGQVGQILSARQDAVRNSSNFGSAISLVASRVVHRTFAGRSV